MNFDSDDMENRVVCADNRDVLPSIPSGSVDLVVTSPPYGNLREYGGFDFSPDFVITELVRVLIDGGVIVWQVGDQSVDGSETGEPFRQAMFFMVSGLRLHDTMIYHKAVCPPFSAGNHRRYEQVFEYMFVFSKGSPKTFNPLVDPVRWPDKRSEKTFCRSRSGIPVAANSKFGIKNYKLRGNVWEYGRERPQLPAAEYGNHPAVMPLQMARDHIHSWSNRADLVFDPFAGSGTTLLCAKELGRVYFGIEVCKEYVATCERRLRQDYLALES